MTQTELDASVAESTGESLSVVRARGFGLFLGGCWGEEELLWFWEQVQVCEDLAPAFWTEAQAV